MEKHQKLLKETGLVTQIEGNIAWVNTESKLSCSSCKVESSCGNGILEKYLAGKIFVSKIDNRLNAKVGDQVVIVIPKVSVTKASLMIYFVPLLCLFIGAVLGDFWFRTELGAIILSTMGLMFGIAIAFFYNRKALFGEQFVPKMVTKTSTRFSSKPFESISVKSL